MADLRRLRSMGRFEVTQYWGLMMIPLLSELRQAQT